ncbi:MAG: hypothetical protein NTV43_18440 [Methylococcales bacterium]|nr:hypothetical protein [Methylococcales bacterium]
MSAHLEQIRKAGFVLELEDGSLFIEPYSELNEAQLQFLKLNKAAIIETLEAEQERGKPYRPTFPRFVTCRTCEHFKSLYAHGGGAGSCLSSPSPSCGAGGAFLWADSKHQCENHAPKHRVGNLPLHTV